MELSFKSDKYKDGAFAVYLKGSIDSETSEPFKKQIFDLIQSGAKHLLIEMSGVKYLSSSGIGAFFEIQKKIDSLQGSFGIYKPQNAVRRVLEIVKWEALEWTWEKHPQDSPLSGLIEPPPEEPPASPSTASKK